MVRSPTRNVRPDVVPFHAPQGVHLALAVGLPTLFCGLAAYWLGGWGPNGPQGLNAVYTVLVSLWSAWRLRTKQGPWLRLWIWVMLTLGCYAGQSLLEGQPWPRTFAIDGTHTLWFLLGLVPAQIGALWAGQLASRARLFQLTVGVPDGRELELLVREYQLDADFSRSNQAILTVSLAALVTVAGVLASTTRYGSGGLSVALFIGFFVLCALAGVLVRTYRREMESLMYGRRWTLGEKLAPLGWASLLLVLAGLGAGATLGIGPWGHDILLPNHSSASTDTSESDPPVASAPAGRNLWLTVLAALIERMLGLQNLLVVAMVLIRAAAFAAPWVVGAFLVWPMLRWVLSGGRETKGLLRRWKELVAAQWAAFLAALRAWWGQPRPEAARPLGTLAAERWLRSFFRVPGRKTPLPEVIDAFLKVTAWAEPVAPYRRGETTREFLDRLVSVLPAASADLEDVRDALDRELFGPGLDRAARAEFLVRVRRLTAQPAVHEGPPGVS